MSKKQHVLILVAVGFALSAAVTVTAQVRLKGQGVSKTASFNGQLATMDDGSGKFAYRPSNIVQRVLQTALNAKANVLIDVAQGQGLEASVSKLVLANDYVILTLMRPDEQQHEIHDVWQVEKFVQGNKDWEEVCKAPSLIRELDKIDAVTAKSVEAAWESVWNDLRGPLWSVEKRLMSEPGFNSLSAQEKQDRVFAEMQKLPKKSPAQIQAETIARWSGLLETTRACLTKAQRAEFDGFVSRHEAALAKASSGVVPPPGLFAAK